MPIATQVARLTCRYQNVHPPLTPLLGTYHFSSSVCRSSNETSTDSQKEEGAMARRLGQMTEESLESGGSSARRAIEEAGFDEDLKRRLEERIAAANFRSEHAGAIALSELPSNAGSLARDIAAAKPWTGTESVEDAALRMLNDAHKPMRVMGRPPTAIRTIPVRVDTGRSKFKPSSGARLANARDQTSIYNTMKDAPMTEDERRQYKKEMKERFSPGARVATVQGLASLANERIEDAIARGQFKNLPRGKKIERDYTASSPFLDTTEYLLNKMIQRQEIVPPWIERQQELVSTATKFRARLRFDWKRHASRMISSAGGTLQDQIQRAEAYAAAERIENPPKKKKESFNTVDSDGHVSQITLAGELRLMSETTLLSNPEPVLVSDIKVEEIHVEALSAPNELDSISSDASDAALGTRVLHSRVFRDPEWERTEYSFLKLSIENLNSLTRSYNLIAPQIAQKPTFSLERELKACYADVAPLLPAEILDRAMKPRAKIEITSHKPGGLLEQAFERKNTRVYDENLQVKGYGFKQFWIDLFRKDS